MTSLPVIKENLKKHKHKRILLNDIAKYISADTEYEDFALAIQTLMDEGVLSPIKAGGYNNRVINLPNKFHLSKERLTDEYKHYLQQYVQSLSTVIDLDYYFKHGEEEWLQDVDYILKINTYIKEQGLPTESATIPERSYHLSGDEKWLQEKGGLQVIERVNLVEKMKLIKEVEPVAFSVNKNFQNQALYKHLIVENKSIFYRILDFLNETSYSTLIYGAGWRVISSIQSFKRQFPLDDKDHVFYYFGDLDYEGIKIWHTLNESFTVAPHQALYHELLRLPLSQGKENQKRQVAAVDVFCEVAVFNELDKVNLINHLGDGYYLPQEALSVNHLRGVLVKELEG